MKRPAAQLGIALPQASAKRAVAKPRPRPAAKPEARRDQAAKKAAAPAPAPPRRPEPRPEPELAAKCRLQRLVIVCGTSRYELALNRQNKDLDKDALSEQNRLGLRSYRGKPGDQAALMAHLSDSYQRYIEKMLEIGLGSATMSFTKFYYTHETLSQQGEDFAARFETMFSFLKKDKASMGIKARYNDQLPERVQQCSELTDRLIVCAAGEHNWVYVRVPTAG